MTIENCDTAINKIIAEQESQIVEQSAMLRIDYNEYSEFRDEAGGRLTDNRSEY